MALINFFKNKKKISHQCSKYSNYSYTIETVEKPVEVTKEKVAGNKIAVAEEIDKPQKENLIFNKKIFVGIIFATVVLLTVGGILGYNALLPRINAKKDFRTAVKFVQQKNKELETKISQSEELIAKKQPLLNEDLILSVENAISDAKAVKITELKAPQKVLDIISRTKELNKTDYSEVITNLNNKCFALEINAKRYQLVNAPTEAYVIQCLKTIPEITDVSAVTEDNDPNGNLNKEGGYTATVYFSHEKLKLDKSVYGDTLIEQGTEAGGAIEVYACVEDAIKRKDYLSVFDGTITASGTHTVIGTVLVRTSNELTASQQKEFEAKIIAALTYIEDVDNKEKPKLNDKSTEAKTIIAPNTTQVTTSSNTDITSPKIKFEGGICSEIDDWGDGMPTDNNTEFVDGDNICLAGRLIGIQSETAITLKWCLPDGTVEYNNFSRSNSEAFNLGKMYCGIGNGSVTITLDSTGEVLGYYEFTVQ